MPILGLYRNLFAVAAHLQRYAFAWNLLGFSGRRIKENKRMLHYRSEPLALA